MLLHKSFTILSYISTVRLSPFSAHFIQERVTFHIFKMILLYNTILAENILTNQPKIFVTFSAPLGGNLVVSSDVITTKISRCSPPPTLRCKVPTARRGLERGRGRLVSCGAESGNFVLFAFPVRRGTLLMITSAQNCFNITIHHSFH